MNLDVVNVFVNTASRFGNPVGICLDPGDALSPDRRQAISAATGFSETVFIGDCISGDIRFFNPQSEVAFAGHAALGAAWYLRRKGYNTTSLRTGCGPISVVDDADTLWVECHVSIMPPWNLLQLAGADDVERLGPDESNGLEHTVAWAWTGPPAESPIRARTFAADWGISEDEANGSGCMLLALALGHAIHVKHGRGSVIRARPSADGVAQVGGDVVAAASRSIDLVSGT